MSLEREVERRRRKGLKGSVPPVDLAERDISDLILAYDIRERGRNLSRLILLRRLQGSSSSASQPSASPSSEPSLPGSSKL